MSRRILDSGRASFEAKNTAQAQRQFDLLLKLLDDPAMEGRAEREDLRCAGQGIQHLTGRGAAAAGPPGGGITNEKPPVSPPAGLRHLPRSRPRS